jgi:hypothetical protein
MNPIFEWPSAAGSMCNVLLAVYHMSGDEKYLGPLFSMAEIRRRYLENPVSSPEPGSEAWCGMEMDFIYAALSKYRFLTGSDEYDDLLDTDAGHYVRYRLTGDRVGVEDYLDIQAVNFRRNFPGFTQEVRFTDRLLAYGRLFRKKWLFADGISGYWEPDHKVLYSTLTGDPGSINNFPMNSVRWLTPPRDFAAFVTDSKTNRFAAELYHFGTGTRQMSAEFYLLEPGEYSVNLTKKVSGEKVSGIPVKIAGPRQVVPLSVPPRTLCTLTVEKGATGVHVQKTAARALAAHLTVTRLHVSGKMLIRYSISRAARVRLELFSVQGRSVRSLYKGRKAAGTHQYSFNTRCLSAGRYVLAGTFDESTYVRKPILIVK